MNAVISGRSGTGLLINEEELTSIFLDEDEEVIYRTGRPNHLLFENNNNLIYLEDVELVEVIDALKFENHKENALLFTLILLDSEQEEEIKSETFEILSQMLEKSSLYSYIESVLLAAPLPNDADIEKALEISGKSAGKVFYLLKRVFELQEYIIEIQLAWDRIPEDVFGSISHRTVFRTTAVREGLFKELVFTLAEGGTLDSFLFKSLKNPAIKKLPQNIAILDNWTKLLDLKRINENLKQSRIPSPEPPIIDHEIIGTKKRSVDRKIIFDKVVSQKNLIIKTMRGHEIPKAEKLTNELITFQLENGGPIFAAKSLCDLAMEAKHVSNSALQLWLSQKATEVASNDGWSWAQYGDALLKFNMFDESLAAFNNAELFSTGDNAELYDTKIVAKTGRAEVLKSQNRLSEALSAYETIMAEHPENVVAKSGRAEVLKSQNRLSEALSAYETIMAEHPEDVVAKNGYASISVLLGDYESALSSLSNAKPVTDQDWIGYHIRGMIQFSLGNLENAESIFNEGIRDYPKPRGKEFFHTALALVKIKQKEYESAAQLLDKVSSPDLQATSNMLRVHAFGALGHRERARQAFMKITQQHSGICLEFKEELRRRYLDEEEPVHNEEWLNESAMTCYLRMAA